MNYFARLVARMAGRQRPVAPRLPSRFEAAPFDAAPPPETVVERVARPVAVSTTAERIVEVERAIREQPPSDVTPPRESSSAPPAARSSSAAERVVEVEHVIREQERSAAAPAREAESVARPASRDASPKERIVELERVIREQVPVVPPPGVTPPIVPAATVAPPAPRASAPAERIVERIIEKQLQPDIAPPRAGPSPQPGAPANDQSLFAAQPNAIEPPAAPAVRREVHTERTHEIATVRTERATVREWREVVRAGTVREHLRTIVEKQLASPPSSTPERAMTERMTRLAPPPMPLPSRRETAVPSESPPAIHVTIGRVDVHAVMPSEPQSRRESAPKQPALSLDDYLAQRRGGSR